MAARAGRSAVTYELCGDMLRVVCSPPLPKTLSAGFQETTALHACTVSFRPPLASSAWTVVLSWISCCALVRLVSNWLQVYLRCSP